MAPLFSIIGDGNVRRNMTGLNIASRETMKTAQVIDYVAPGSLDNAFKEIRPDSTVCIIAALTDLLLSGGDKMEAQLIMRNTNGVKEDSARIVYTQYLVPNV